MFQKHQPSSRQLKRQKAKEQRKSKHDFKELPPPLGTREDSIEYSHKYVQIIQLLISMVERHFNITDINEVVKNPVFAGNAALLLGHQKEPAAMEFLNMVKTVKTEEELELFFLLKQPSLGELKGGSRCLPLNPISIPTTTESTTSTSTPEERLSLAEL